jgi:hypothetical protein
MVAGSRPGAAVTRIRYVAGGGSSSVFSSALAAFGFIRSAGAITTTLARCRCALNCVNEVTSRIRSTPIVSFHSGSPSSPKLSCVTRIRSGCWPAIA